MKSQISNFKSGPPARRAPLNLDDSAGSVSPAQIRALHRAPGVREGANVSVGNRHEFLQDQIRARYGARSCKELSKAQASELLERLGTAPLTGKPKPPRRTGTIKLLRTWHPAYIRRFALRPYDPHVNSRGLGWSEKRLSEWLQKKFGVDAPEKLGTAQSAGEVILQLKSKIRYRDQQPWREGSGSKGSGSKGSGSFCMPKGA